MRLFDKCMLIVGATINMVQTPCISAFASSYVNRLIVSAKNFFSEISDGSDGNDTTFLKPLAYLCACI